MASLHAADHSYHTAESKQHQWMDGATQGSGKVAPALTLPQGERLYNAGKNEQETSARMGMYTELVLACELKKDVPEEVLNLLRFMCGGVQRPPRPADEDLPAHPLFQTTRWEGVLNAGSFYFPGKPYSNLRVPYHNAYLTVRSNLKNYGSEIQYLLHWLAPYSESGGFVGYYRYEETPCPTLIFFAEGKAHIQSVRVQDPADWLYVDEILPDLDDEDDGKEDHV